MKYKSVLLSVFFILMLPQLLFFLLRDEDPNHETVVPECETVSEVPEIAAKQHMIRVKNGNSILNMDLEDYLTGVVLGEMPAEFEQEALKAQAVAARTFTLKSVQRNSKHQDADVCTDPACCQAYTASEEYSGDISLQNKVFSAVKDTAGQVVTFQGVLIEATYFSCSGGQTEDAVAVWGTDVPYLQSVESPGEEIANKFESETSFQRSDFLSKLGLPRDTLLTDGNISVTYTDGGGVATLSIGDRSYSGVEVRRLLNLYSTVFHLNILDDEVLISTKGYGHRVGMSQYGAEAMALAGKRYDEILAHYYSGTELTTLSAKEIETIFDKEENF